MTSTRVSGFMHTLRQTHKHTHAYSQHTCRYLTLFVIIRLQWKGRIKVIERQV